MIPGQTPYPKLLPIAVLLIFVAGSCRRPEAKVANENPDISKSTTSKKWDSSDRFAPISVTILDEENGLPIAGANVQVLCLGGTPFEDSHDTTNHAGAATITSFDGDFVGISIQKDGYNSTNIFVPRTNPKVRLKKMSETSQSVMK